MDKLKEVINPRFASAVFCDDIRYEIGNKISLIGVYNRDLLVHEFPTNLSKLAVALIIDTPIENPVNSLGVFVENGNERIFEIPSQGVEAFAQALPKTDIKGQDDLTRATLAVNFFLPPQPILEPCTIRVKVVADDQIITAGKLFISTIQG